MLNAYIRALPVLQARDSLARIRDARLAQPQDKASVSAARAAVRALERQAGYAQRSERPVSQAGAQAMLAGMGIGMEIVKLPAGAGAPTDA